jgi:hypothetical protein
MNNEELLFYFISFFFMQNLKDNLRHICHRIQMKIQIIDRHLVGEGLMLRNVR